MAAGEPPAPPLFELCEATVVRSGRTVLDAVNLCVRRGEHTVILGANGSGKSTLVRLLERQLHPLARPGAAHPPIRVMGQRLWNCFALRRELGIVSADLDRELLATPEVAVRQAVLAAFFGSLLWPLDAAPTDDQKVTVAAMLEQLGLVEFADRMLDTLSVGELRRVMLARALVHRPHTLLLDEPCNGLDPGARRRLLETLAELAGGGVTLVLVTHHLDEVLPCFQRALLMQGGRIVGDGTTQDCLTPQRLAALYGTSPDTPGLRAHGCSPGVTHILRG